MLTNSLVHVHKSTCIFKNKNRKQLLNFPQRLLFISEIVNRVKQRSYPPFRPSMLTDQYEGISTITNLMEQCWVDSEHQRPSFATVENYIRKHIQNGK